MNKQFKLLLFVFFIFSTNFVFSGCSKDETSLVKAMLKTTNSTSYESNLKLTLNTDATTERLVENYMDTGLKVYKSFGSVTMDVYSKVSRSSDDLITKQESKMAFDIGGISANASVWVDANYSGQKPEFKEVIKFPKVYSVIFPLQFAGREYFVIDKEGMDSLEKDISSRKENVPVNKFFSNSIWQSLSKLDQNYMANMTSDISAYIESFAAIYQPGFTAVTNKGTSQYLGSECTCYELKLNDRTAKQLAKSLILTLMDSREARDLVKQKLKAMYGNSFTDSQIDALFGNADSNMSELKKGVYAYFDSIADVKFLGKDGITFEFFVDKDGYLVGTNGIVDLKLSKNELAKVTKSNQNLAIEGEDPNASQPDEVVMLKFTINNDVKNINKPISIELPNIPDSEKVSIQDLLNHEKEQERLLKEEKERQEKKYEEMNAKKGKVTLKFNNERISGSLYPSYPYSNYSSYDYNYNPYDNEVFIVDNRMIFPMAPILHKMDLQYSWDGSNQQIICYRNGDTIIFTIGKKEVEVNGKKQNIEVAPRIINGKTYIPVRTLCDLFGAELQWDDTLKTANITYSEKVGL